MPRNSNYGKQGEWMDCKKQLMYGQKILLNIIKAIAPTFTTQAKHQNNMSRALKWGTVCLCNSKIIRDMIKNKKYNFFKFLHF